MSAADKYTHIRILKTTKAEIEQLKSVLTRAYEESTSPVPIQNADVGCTTDEAVHRAVSYLLNERNRKNQPRRRRSRKAREIAPVVTDAVQIAS